MSKLTDFRVAVLAAEDGNWVTSRRPDDLPALNRAMVALFSRSLATNRA